MKVAGLTVSNMAMGHTQIKKESLSTAFGSIQRDNTGSQLLTNNSNELVKYTKKVIQN